jgi:molecular chaperone GrpE
MDKDKDQKTEETEKKELEADDVSFEDTEEVEMESSLGDKLKKLREKLKETEKEKKEYLTNWQKERADFINYRKDEEKRKDEFRKYLNESFIESMLPALDNFSSAMRNREIWEKVDEAWRKGIEYIKSQFENTLRDYGLELIEPKPGEHFDPNLHQSVMSVETDDPEKDHTIEKVIQEGYKVKGNVLRGAKVAIFINKKKSPEGDQE